MSGLIPFQPEDWRRSLKGAFRSGRALSAFLKDENNSREAEQIHSFNDEIYPVFVPRALAARMKLHGPESALWKQFAPHPAEYDDSQQKGLFDPIGDSTHAKSDGIIHRYKSRLLFAPTTVCPVNCRYCFRKNELAAREDILKGKLAALERYLQEHPEVDEVILTGGDPLMLSDQKLEEIIESLRGKVRYLRFHTRAPIILPERITASFLQIIEKACLYFEVASMAIHANHASEFCDDNKRAIKLLSATGLLLLSQSALLKGVNDELSALKELYQAFAALGVRSYYLHHPDKAKGAMQFYLPLSQGRKLYGQLREELPGWAIPHYVIDPENGQGKNLAYNPESLEYSGMILDRFNRLHPQFP